MSDRAWVVLRLAVLVVSGCLIGYSLFRLATRLEVDADWLTSGQVIWINPEAPVPGLGLDDYVIAVDGLPVQTAGMLFTGKAIGESVIITVAGDAGDTEETRLQLTLRPAGPSDWSWWLGVVLVILGFAAAGSVLAFSRLTPGDDTHKARSLSVHFLLIAVCLALGLHSNRGPVWVYQGYVVATWVAGAVVIRTHLIFPQPFGRNRRSLIDTVLVGVVGLGLVLTFALPHDYNGAVSSIGRNLNQSWLLLTGTTCVLLLAIGLWRTSELAERRQTGIVAAGGIAALVPFIVLAVVPWANGLLLNTYRLEFLTLLFMPAAYGYALLRYRQLARDHWFPRLVTSILSVSFVALTVFGGVAGLRLLGLSAEGLLAAAVALTGGSTVVAVSVVRRWLDWLLFRRWYNPLEVAASVVQRLDLHVDALNVAGQIEGVIGRELQMPSQVLIREADQSFRGAAGSLPGASGLVRVLSAAGRMLERDELERLPDLTGDDRRLLAAAWIQGAIALPSRAGVAGILLLGHKAGATFVDPVDLTVLQIVRWAAGQVLESAIAYRKLQEAPRLLARARADERQFLARELHDQHIQPLNVLMWSLQPIRGRVASAEAIEGLRAQIAEHMEGLRGVCSQLRTNELDTLGLEATVRILTSAAAQRCGVEALVTVSNPGGIDVPQAVAESAVGVVREAVANVAKHAEARTLTVAVTVHRDRVRVQVEDDGRGFDVDEARVRAANTNHFGLVGLQEQALLVAGALTLESTVGRGTRVTADLPLQPDSDGTQV